LPDSQHVLQTQLLHLSLTEASALQQLPLPLLLLGTFAARCNHELVCLVPPLLLLLPPLLLLLLLLLLWYGPLL
jgi:hypothetical protein